MTKSQVLLTGIVIFLLVIGTVSPVMAAEEHMSEQNHENDDNQQVNDDDRRATEEKFSRFSHEGYDEKHHCPTPVPPSYTAIVNLTIDSSLMNATPHWMFLAAGKTEQKGLLSYIRQANVSAKKKAQWSMFMMKSWMKYPVKYIKIGDGAILVPGKTPYKLSMTPKENSTFQEIERYIAEDISNVQTEEVSVKWWAGGKDSTHQKFMTVAFDGKDYPDSLVKSAILAADAPDTFCDNSPIPACQQINHGFVPIGISLNPIIIIPSTIGGLGRAPDNFGDYASRAKLQYALHDYKEAFKNMGYASHFITDLGNPFHTPNAQIIGLEYVDSPLSNIIFPNSKMIINYKDLHDNYETMVAENWEKYYYENTDTYYILDPTYSAKVHGSYSWAANYPVVYNCYWHYVLTNNMDFSQDPVITAITVNRVTESMKHTRGLVHFVTGGQAPTLTITATAGEHGSISPEGFVPVNYGDTPTFTIIPEDGYLVDQILVDRESKNTNPYTFEEPVTLDHTIEATFIKEFSDNQMLTSGHSELYISTGKTVTVNSSKFFWNGTGRVYLTGGNSYTSTSADDAFDVNINGNSLTFASPYHAVYEGIPDITSICNTGENQLTLNVRDIWGVHLGCRQTWLYFDYGQNKNMVTEYLPESSSEETYLKTHLTNTTEIDITEFLKTEP
jgi:hypothetical protein